MSRSHRIHEEHMSHRARFYLLIAAARHFIIGLFCILDPTSFTTPSYQGIIEAFAGFPNSSAIMLWGYLFLITGTAYLLAAILTQESLARIGLFLLVVTSAAKAGGFIAASVEGMSAGPTGGVVWLTIALKDATMLRQPLRNPFEPLTQQMAVDLMRGEK